MLARQASSGLRTSCRRMLTSPAAYDYVVIGGGSGGIASARRAAQQGAKVAVVEAGRLGGTCVNVGCVPKKLMYHAADMRDTLAIAPFYGVLPHGERPEVDFAALKANRDAYVAKLNRIYASNLEGSGVDHVQGWGTLGQPGEVRVQLADGQETVLLAKNVLLAPGGQPWVPDIPGADLAITSDGFFDLEALPRRVVVVGGGYIATELAGVLHGLGSEVEVVARAEGLLRGFDVEIARALQESMEQVGVQVHTCAKVVGVSRAGEGKEGLVAEVESVLDGSRWTVEGDTVLMATGRSPRTEGLFGAGSSVKLDGFGAIEVDAMQQTSQPGVFAVGDVTGRAELTPVAIAAGRLLSDRLFGGDGHPATRGRDLQHAALDYSTIPTAVFSHPPIGTVGLTQEEAEEQFGADNVIVHRSRFRSLFFGMAPDDSGVHKQTSLMKLVCQRNAADDRPGTERVVGVHLLGPSSDEIIQAVAIAVRMGATKQDFDSAVAVHPTAAEELVTMQPWSPHYA